MVARALHGNARGRARTDERIQFRPTHRLPLNEESQRAGKQSQHHHRPQNQQQRKASSRSDHAAASLSPRTHGVGGGSRNARTKTRDSRSTKGHH